MSAEIKRRCYKCGRSPAEDPLIKLFRFPNPGKTNTLRCELWAKHVFPDKEYWSQQFQHKLYSEHRMLCNRHFPRTSFSDFPLGSQKLHRFAVPEDCKENEPKPSSSLKDCSMDELNKPETSGRHDSLISQRIPVNENEPQPSSSYNVSMDVPNKLEMSGRHDSLMSKRIPLNEKAPSRKVSFGQTEILADFAETHQHIAFGGRFCSLQDLNNARRAWESVTVSLNAVGLKKTPEQWRKYWIEYKAKLKSMAADSRTGTETGPAGRLRPLSEREHQLLELINHLAAERLPDPNDPDMHESPRPQASSPESQPNSLEVEWLDYDSEFDEELDKEETDEFLSVEPQGDTEPIAVQSASETEDEGPVKELSKKGGKSRKKLQHSVNKSDGLSRRHSFGEFKDKRRELNECSGFSATPLQNNIINTSSSKTDQQDLDTRPKRSSLSDLTATEYFHLKKYKSPETQDPDLLFFHSILPEMKQMSPEQKRQFKMGVWSLASQILEPNAIDSPSEHTYEVILKR